MDYDSSDERHNEIMEYLVSEGAAFLDGVDENGEAIYKFDMEMLEEVMPDMYEVLMNDMDEQLIHLYKKGLINVTYDEELNAILEVSEEGKQALIENGFSFDDYEE